MRPEKPNSPLATEPRSPQAVAIKSITFVGPQDGPGFGVKSSLSSDRRYALEYLPVMRHFRVVYSPDGAEPITAYIPEVRAMYWVPA